MPDFDKLAEPVRRLHQLLQDRQPGLGTWCTFVGENWKTVAEMWADQLPQRVAPELLRELESVEVTLYAEWLRADGSGKHLRSILEHMSPQIVAAGGDSIWVRRPTERAK